MHTCKRSGLLRLGSTRHWRWEAGTARGRGARGRHFAGHCSVPLLRAKARAVWGQRAVQCRASAQPTHPDTSGGASHISTWCWQWSRLLRKACRPYASKHAATHGAASEWRRGAVRAHGRRMPPLHCLLLLQQWCGTAGIPVRVACTVCTSHGTGNHGRRSCKVCQAMGILPTAIT